MKHRAAACRRSQKIIRGGIGLLRDRPLLVRRAGRGPSGVCASRAAPVRSWTEEEAARDADDVRHISEQVFRVVLGL